MAQADAVHAAVPGDVGSIGLVVALIQKKRLFVRHCGTYGEPVTISDRLLLWLLESIASPKRVVLATGGSDSPPSRTNPSIQWIFSTTLTKAELDHFPPARAWSPGAPLRLITVCRLVEGKNVQSVLSALPLIQAAETNIHLDILGDGEYRPALEKLADELGICDIVTFHGNVNHERVLQQLSQSHIFVFPTRVKEGFPKAVLEAQACGLPVIATRVSVIPELLKNGSGCLLEDTIPQAVAEAISKLLSGWESLPRMGCLARESARGYTLEAWGGAIGDRLQAAWGPLRGDPK
jgi:glycosyltransferase involved in cell wall biosynthesis